LTMNCERYGPVKQAPRDAGVQRRAARHDGHRVDAFGEAAAECVADPGPQRRHERGAAHEHDAPDRRRREAVALEQALAGSGRASSVRPV